jgi:hypothetical protein
MSLVMIYIQASCVNSMSILVDAIESPMLS